MNILLTLNTKYAKYAAVMITSLFTNNAKNDIHIYVLYDDLCNEEQIILKEIVTLFKGNITFLKIDRTIFESFPTTNLLTVECYFICMAHMFLPREMERILYLDADIIVDGDLTQLYYSDFDGNFIIACGQTFSLLEGNYFKIGAQAERGEIFNSGVLIFDLKKFRAMVKMDDYISAAASVRNNFMLADQGLLNIVFENRVKLISSYYYNFRISLLEDHIREKLQLPEGKPVIYHYVTRDYYRIGFSGKPWDLTLDKSEKDILYECGIQERAYIYRLADEYTMRMFELWWEYAKKTDRYEEFVSQMIANKTDILSLFFAGGRIDNAQSLINAERKRRKEFELIQKSANVEKNTERLYEELERYIDELSPDDAIKTMRNMHEGVIRNMKRSGRKIRVAFMVYTSAEWQCEKIYRLMDDDSCFEPWIVLCGYNHGNNKEIRDAYVRVCSDFRRSGTYRIEYLGYVNRYACIGQLDKYDIIFYFNPFRYSLIPNEANLTKRKITQLAIHIPYGIYQEDKRDAYYQTGYYDVPVFKMSWRYFAEDEYMPLVLKNEARLGDYNVDVSGLPKMDVLLDNTFHVRNGLWKGVSDNTIKVIWAPHFNMKKGMNGTFFENYKWFLEYARTHSDSSWIIRPHPRMIIGVLENGVFENEEEYYEYLKEWNDLPNARVLEGGDYFDIFATSDCLIHDSLSFLSEYLYTGKPMLQLMPEKPRSVNALGKGIRKVIYKSRGNNYQAIKDFIDMVRNGEDELKEKREEFVEHALDYKKNNNGLSASEYIYREIKKRVG